MPTIALNQFGMNVAKGQVDLRTGHLPISCQIDVTSTLGADGAAGCVPGQAVKVVDSAGGIPKVIECAADEDDVFGFIVYDVKSSKFMRGDRCEVLIGMNGVMYMEASAAIARNAEVMIVPTGAKVVTATSGNRIVGRALDKASGAGKFIRVAVYLPGALKA